MPSASVLVVTNTTMAHIDDGAQVTAAHDIAVEAHATESILVTVATGAFSGAAVSGSVSVVSLKDVTYAYIGNSATTNAAGAHANAGGNVLVSASDDTDTFTIAGSLAIGVDIGSLGGSVAVTVLNKDTRAFLGTHSVVNASGNFTSPTGFFSDPTFRGLDVEAASSESLFGVTAAGSGGFYAGLAGGVRGRHHE